MNQVFQSIGMHKQSFHQMQRRKSYVREEFGQLLYLVHQIRRDHPRMSVREIYNKLKPSSMGRDRFEQMCFENGFRVTRKKNFRKTTDSRGVIRFPNLIKEIEVTGVNQVFVSDITYFELNGRFYYITLIMDLFNREIVGHYVDDSLRTSQTTIPALHRAIRERGRSNLKGAIIHSDGGGQYYCKEFRRLTEDLGMINSMTEESVFENPHAERLNGVIKNNYLYPYAPSSLKSLKDKLNKAVKMYNYGKSHLALNGKTPVEYRYESSVENQKNEIRYFQFSTENYNNQNMKILM